MVEGERQWQHAACRRLTVVYQHALVDAAGADDRDLRRNDDQVGKSAADHAEIRQRDRRAAQLLRRDRARGGVGPQPIEAGTQVARVALADIAQHRHDEAALGIDRDADVDALDQPALARLGVVPGIERGLGLAGGCHGAHDADGDVLALLPIVDVGLVVHGGANHLGMGRRHALRHRPAHAPQRLGRPRFGQALGGALDVRPRDRPARPAGLHEVEIDVELARQRPDRGKDLKGSRRHRGRCLGASWRLLLLPELAHDRSGVALRALGEFDQRSPDLDQVALAAEQARDAAAPGGRHLDDGLVGLERDERLIDDHAVALVDVPRHDFGFFEPFAEIRQYELAHGTFPLSGELTDFAGRSHDAGDRGDITLLEPRKRHDRIVARDSGDRRQQGGQPALGQERGDLGAEAAGACRLVHEDAAPGPRHRGQHGLLVVRFEGREIDDLRVDPLRSELVGSRERLFHRGAPADQGNVAALPQHEGDIERQRLAVILDLSLRCAVDARRFQKHHRVRIADRGEQEPIGAFRRGRHHHP